MSRNLLEIGSSVIHRCGENGFSDKAARDFVKDALRTVNTEKLLVRCVLLLATADWCWLSSPLPKKIRDQFKEELGYEVPLIGGSAAGFYCSTESNPFIKQGLVLLAFCSNDLLVSVDFLEEPYSIKREDRTPKLKKLADKLEEKAGVKLGASARRSLLGFLPGIVSDKRGNRAYRDNELHEDILSAFGYRYQLFGASATDEIAATTGYQFANDKCLKSGLALAIIETDLSTGAAMAHGFAPYSGLRVSVDALTGGVESGYEITHLDEKPAFQRLQELKDGGVIRFEKPVFGLPYGSDFHVLWPLEISDTNGGGIKLKRKVALGDRLYVLDALPEQMIESGSKALKFAIERSGASMSDLKLFLCFSCASRVRQYAVHGANWKEAVNQVHQDYPGIPLVIVLCAGEFGVDEFQGARANNMSLSIICMASDYSRHAKASTLQKDLLRATSRLLTCDSPIKVMEAALNGAISAGATGGIICQVDNKLRRILGKGFGHAVQARHSKHDWHAVAELTNRALPENIGGRFPPDLREWSMPAVSGIPFPLDFTESQTDDIEDKEDILTLVVRTLQAIFIHDSRIPKFHCDQKTRAKGNIICQLVIPLVGSRFKPVATLQLSFPDNTSLDRESFALWVSYGQRVADALERAQEVEEREMLSDITRLSDEIMRTPIDLRESHYKWCHEYLYKVIDRLGADGAHLRVSVTNTDEHQLVAPVGHLADLLPETRPKISQEKGSYKRQVLESGGWISNVKEDTASFLHKVKALERQEQYATALARELRKIESLAILPLYNQKRITGSFDVYSKTRYFFTERRERIVRAAAKLAEDILRAKEAEYERARLNEEKDNLEVEREWILRSLTLTTEGVAEHPPRSAGRRTVASQKLHRLTTGGFAERRLRLLLERVCLKVKANVASIFVWYAEPEKLILHTSYNWYKNMDGLANYKQGEGWAGSIALKDEDISIVSPASGDTNTCTKKYYEHMVPPEHRVAKGACDARIGIRLTADKDLVGVVTFSYFQENTQHLVQNDKTIISFLKAVSSLITLAVEAANQEAAKNLMQRLVETKNDVAESLIHKAQSPDRGWPLVVNTIREGFQVKRVNYYHVRRDKKFELVWSSPSDTRNTRLEQGEPTDLFGAMRDVVVNKQEFLVTSPTDNRLKQWPNAEGVKNLFAVPIISAEGTVRGVLEFINRIETPEHPFGFFDEMERGMAWDITTPLAAALEQSEHDKALGELTTKLATASRIGASGLFGAIVMHNVLAPFSNMRGSIDWLIKHPDSSEQDRAKHLKRIEASYTQALEIINQAAHRGSPSLQRVSLRAIVRQALRAIEPEISIPGVKVKVKNVDDHQRVMVIVDLWSIVGALVNLLSNALDAMKGSGVLTISTEIATDGQRAFIRIHNTGPRLTEAEIARFFHPGVTTKDEKSHLGLGLSLAKQAVETVGGTIQMSPASVGVEATVTLPVASSQHPSADPRKGELS